MNKTKTDLIKLEHEIQHALKRPLHLRMEYFFRKRYCLLAVVTLMSIAIAKSDGRFLDLVRDAYNQGYSIIGAYLREEPARATTTVAIARIPAITSR